MERERNRRLDGWLNFSSAKYTHSLIKKNNLLSISNRLAFSNSKRQLTTNVSDIIHGFQMDALRVSSSVRSAGSTADVTDSLTGGAVA